MSPPHPPHSTSSPTAQQRYSGSLRTVSCTSPESLHNADIRKNGTKTCSESPKYEPVRTPVGYSRAPPAPTRSSSMLSNRTANLTSLLQQITRCGEALQQAQQVQACGEWRSAGPGESLSSSQLQSQPLQSRRRRISSGGGADLAPAAAPGWSSQKVVPAEITSHQLVLQDVLRHLQEGVRQQQTLLRQLQVHRSVMQVKEEELETQRRCLEEWKQQQQLLLQQERKDFAQLQEEMIHLRASMEALNERATATQDELQSQQQRQREQHQLLVDQQQLLQTEAAEVVALANGCEASFKETDDRVQQQRQQIERVQQLQQEIKKQVGELVQELRTLRLQQQTAAKKTEEEQVRLEEVQLQQEQLSQQVERLTKRVEEEALARRRDGIHLEQVLQQQQRCLSAETLLQKAAGDWQRRQEEAENVIFSKLQNVLQQRAAEHLRHFFEERQQLQQQHQQEIQELREAVLQLRRKGEKIEVQQQEQQLLLQQRHATVEKVCCAVSQVQQGFNQLARTQKAATERLQQQQHLRKDVEQLQKGYKELLSVVAGCGASEKTTIPKAVANACKDGEGVMARVETAASQEARKNAAGLTAPVQRTAVLLAEGSQQSVEEAEQTRPNCNNKSGRTAACAPQQMRREELTARKSASGSPYTLQTPTQRPQQGQQQGQDLQQRIRRTYEGRRNGDVDAAAAAAGHGSAVAGAGAVVGAAVCALDAGTAAAAASGVTSSNDKISAADPSSCSTRLSTASTEGPEAGREQQHFHVQHQHQQVKEQHQDQQLLQPQAAFRLHLQENAKAKQQQLQQPPTAKRQSGTAADVDSERNVNATNNSGGVSTAADAKFACCQRPLSAQMPSAHSSSGSYGLKNSSSRELASDGANTSSNNRLGSSSGSSRNTGLESSCLSVHAADQPPATHAHRTASTACAAAVSVNGREEASSHLTRSSGSSHSNSSYEGSKSSNSGSRSSSSSSGSRSSSNSRMESPEGNNHQLLAPPSRGATAEALQAHRRGSNRAAEREEEEKGEEGKKGPLAAADVRRRASQLATPRTAADLTVLSPCATWSGDDSSRETTRPWGGEGAGEKMEWRIDNFLEALEGALQSENNSLWSPLFSFNGVEDLQMEFVPNALCLSSRSGSPKEKLDNILTDRACVCALYLWASSSKVFSCSLAIGYEKKNVLMRPPSSSSSSASNVRFCCAEPCNAALWNHVNTKDNSLVVSVTNFQVFT